MNTNVNYMKNRAKGVFSKKPKKARVPVKEPIIEQNRIVTLLQFDKKDFDELQQIGYDLASQLEKANKPSFLKGTLQAAKSLITQ